MHIDLNKRSWQWILLVCLAFIWGSSFILMKRGLQSFTGMQVGAMRIFFSFLFFLPLIYRHAGKIDKSNLRSLLIVGFIGNTIPAFLFATAQTRIDSSLAGILNSLTPIFTMIIGVTLYANRIRWVSVGGLILGLAGAGGLILSQGKLPLEASGSWYSLLAILATVCYGINVNEIKFRLRELDGVAIASLGFLFPGPLAGILLLTGDYSMAASSGEMVSSLAAVVALAFFSSFLAVITMNILIKFTTTLFAASVTYIIPIFAVIWGINDGERFLAVQALWAVLILFGVYLVNRGKDPVVR
jgi:drug/metabolite transporter (DMT)-like permease